jgi:hypothetical protein
MLQGRKMTPPERTSNSQRVYGAILLAALALTFLSLRFVRPTDCQALCYPPESASCPDGSCRFSEQRAGLPIPILVDYPGGGSPTGGWGILGPEDLPNPTSFLVDVLFYFALLWLARYLVQTLVLHTQPFEVPGLALSLVLMLAVAITGYHLYHLFPPR